MLCAKLLSFGMLSDDELDEYVSSLLTNQATRQATAYSTLGYRAFLNSRKRDGPAGKPNTRFLKNIVKHVDGFNAALARKEEKESQEKLKDLRNRDEEKPHGSKVDISRTRRRKEDRSARRKADRSRSPSYRRDSDSDRGSRRKRVRRSDSSDEDHKESRYRRSGHREAEDKEHRTHETHDNRRHRYRESDDETERRHHHRHRHRKSREERSHRSNVTERQSPSRSHSVSRERYHRESTRDRRHSIKQPKSSPSEGSSYSHHHRKSTYDGPIDVHRTTESPKPKLNGSGSPSLKPVDSPIGPSLPVSGPEFLLAKGRGNMNGGTLDAKFSESYDPRTDVDSHQSDPEDKYELDDWGLALRALRERQSYFLSQAMTERLTDSEIKTATPTWPTYRKGEREWDKGKVVLDDGSVGVEVWGVKKPI